MIESGFFALLGDSTMRKQGRRGNSEGSIYQMQDGRWRAAVTTGWKLNASGAKIPKRKVFTAATRHEVAKAMHDALRDQQRGIAIISDKQELSAFLTQWLDQVVRPNVRPKTHRTYSDLVRKHISPALGEISLGRLSPQHVREFLNTKLASGLSARTVKHLLVTLRGALAVAVKDGLLPRNVATVVDPPRVPRPDIHFLTPEQARAFLEAVKGSRFEAAYTSAVSLGLRQGEVLGLKWDDVNLETGLLTVRAALQRVNKKLTRIEPKSSTSRRSIQLPDACIASLVKHKSDQNAQRRWAGTRWQETGYVFTTRVGTPVDPRDLLREYYALTRPKPKTPDEPAPTLAFPRVRFHDLRHSAASLLLAQGVSARYIAELLGHSQVSFTLQTYAHVLPEVQKQTASKMDDILNPSRVATSVATKPTRKGSKKSLSA
jgi:integrase